MPIYTALVASEDGLAFARQVFARARPGYHPITTGSVQKVIDEARPVARDVAPQQATSSETTVNAPPLPPPARIQGQPGKAAPVEDPAKPPPAATK